MSVTQINSAAGEGARGSERVRKWAHFYVWKLGWAVAPCWLPAVGVGGGCMCPDGEGCPWPGKHLVDDRGASRVVRTAGLVVGNEKGEMDREAVREAWPEDHPSVARGAWGVAALCGSESAMLIWDAPAGTDMPVGWLGEGSLVATTPRHGRHWFFRLEPGEAIASVAGGVGSRLGIGGSVLADGSYVALYPRPGYEWVGGGAVLGAGADGLAPVPAGMRMMLDSAGVLLGGIADIHEDDPWRCMPGAGLAGTVGRTLSRVGDVRRFVDGWGHKARYTPGLGWAMWTQRGWVWGEGAEMEITRIVHDELIAAVRLEARRARDAGLDQESNQLRAYAGGMSKRTKSYLIGDLIGDPRIQVAGGAGAWDADGAVVGLPLVDGVGRVVELESGRVLAVAREKLVSRVLGAGLGGRWQESVAVRKYLMDLEAVHGEGFMRLLKRAAGATAFGSGALEAAMRRSGVKLVGGTDIVVVLGGQPRSGKTTFVETLGIVLGGYAKPVMPDMLFGDRGNKGSDIAGIRGMRMLYLSEPPAGARLNVPLLKSLSGGDSLTGRGVYARNEVTFSPDCTVWIATNHPLEHSDEALWDRLKIFTFRSDYSGSGGESWVREAMKKDPGEQAAFLSWVLEGARELVLEGWGDVGEWEGAVAAERAGTDPLARFMDEMLVVGPAAAGEEMALDALMSLFAGWWAVEGEGSGKLEMSRSQIRKELEYRLVRAGGVMRGKRGPLANVRRAGGGV